MLVFIDSFHRGYLLILAGVLLCTSSCTRLAQQADSSVVNVIDFGAVPNDGIDDRDAIQEALDYASRYSIPRILIPEGLYHVSRTSVAGSAYCLNLHSGQTLMGASTAPTILQMLPNQENYTRIIYIDGVTDVDIQHITFNGDRGSQSQVPRWEHLHGIFLNNAKNVTITDCRFISTRGDGITIRGPEQPAKNIVVKHCHFEDNGRNGITLGSGFDGVLIDSCTFDATTMHASPIDSEPETGFCRNVIIKNCTVTNDKNEAALVTFGGHVPVYNYEVFDNTFNNCQLLFAYAYDSRVYKNTLTTKDMDRASLKFIFSNTGVEVFNNNIETKAKFVEAISTKYGKIDGGVVRDNNVKVTGSEAGYAIKIQGIDNFSISNNSITASQETTLAAIYLRTTADMSNVKIKNNVFENFDSYITIQGFKEYKMNASTIDNTLKNVNVVDTKYIGSKRILDRLIDPSMIRSKQ